MTLTPEVKQAINLAAKEAARHAVQQTLLMLGIDASTPEEVRQAQQDFAWVRRIRTLTTDRSGKYWMVVFSTVMGIVGSGATILIQQLFAGVPHP